MKEQIIEWFRDSIHESGGSKAVIGISGGKDSTIAAAIAVEALGKENVIGVMMPFGLQKDIGDSKRVCEILGIKSLCFDIFDSVKPIIEGICIFTDGISEVTRINTLPRIRMTVLYAIAGSIPGARVINTSNRSEAYIGYCTKWGDMCGDIYPLLNLTATEVVQLGLEFTDIPRELILKTPADGLTDKSDEENIGFTYAELDRYLMHGIVNLSGATIKKIDEMHKAALHKTGPKIAFSPQRGNQ